MLNRINQPNTFKHSKVKVIDAHRTQRIVANSPASRRSHQWQRNTAKAKDNPCCDLALFQSCMHALETTKQHQALTEQSIKQTEDEEAHTDRITEFPDTQQFN